MRRNQPGRPWNRETKESLDRAWERRGAYPTLIAQHRRALAARPDDFGSRYLLAGCLYGDGQVEQALVEWEQVGAAGDTGWAALAQETLQSLRLRDIR